MPALRLVSELNYGLWLVSVGMQWTFYNHGPNPSSMAVLCNCLARSLYSADVFLSAASFPILGWPQFVMSIIVTCRDKECTNCVHSHLMSSKRLPSAGLGLTVPLWCWWPPGVTKSRSRRWILQTASPAAPPGGKIIDLNSVPFLPSSGYFLRLVFWKTKNFHNKIWS